MIGLVACSAGKLDRAAPARELYTSDLFRKSLAFARSCCSATYVVSALYGLVEIEQVIEPYDKTVARMSVVERTRWAAEIAEQVIARHGRELYAILAGKAYAYPLYCELFDRGGFITEPLRGMQIGERLSWLAAQTRRAA